MAITDLLPPIQYVIDEDGNKTAVLIDFAAWEQMLIRLNTLEDELEKLEETEDIRAALEVETLIQRGQETSRDWDQFEAELDELPA